MATFVHAKTDDVISTLSSQTFTYAATPGTVATNLITGSTTGVDESIPLTGLTGSKSWEANDLRDAHYSRVDSFKTVGSFENVTMIASYPSGAQVYETAYVDNAHMFGYATCETLGRCTGNGVTVGSKCKGGKGFCYTSSAGTLECGRTISTSNRFGGNVQQVYKQLPGSTDWVIKPCPRGSPATNGGATGTVVQSKRLLIAGCMLTADASYSASAEVHLPQACAAPAHLEPGCLFPGALNYAPGSKESAFCRYRTDGCMDSTALNYNSLATFDDGSCIRRELGCTIKPDTYSGNSYAAVNGKIDSNTPMYKGLYHDENIRWIDRYNEADHLAMQKTVTNYNENATVLFGCIIAVEGCMDSNAVNYDPKATINTQSWCVPKVTGCMDPTAVNFDPAATIQAAKSDAKGCRYVAGCMDPVAMNYYSKATWQPNTTMFQCFYPVFGCLHPAAVNEGCAGPSNSECKNAENQNVATKHIASMCQFPIPTTVAPEGQELQLAVSTVIAGKAEDNVGLMKAIEDAFNQVYAGNGPKFTTFMKDVATGDLYDKGGKIGRRRLQAATGTETTFVRPVSSADEAASAISALGDLSKEALQSAFSSVSGVSVQSGGVATAVFAPKLKRKWSAGAVAGLVIGLLAATILIGGGAYMYMKKKGMMGVKTVVPA